MFVLYPPGNIFLMYLEIFINALLGCTWAISFWSLFKNKILKHKHQFGNRANSLERGWMYANIYIYQIVYTIWNSVSHGIKWLPTRLQPRQGLIKGLDVCKFILIITKGLFPNSLPTSHFVSYKKWSQFGRNNFSKGRPKV